VCSTYRKKKLIGFTNVYNSIGSKNNINFFIVLLSMPKLFIYDQNNIVDIFNLVLKFENHKNIYNILSCGVKILSNVI